MALRPAIFWAGLSGVLALEGMTFFIPRGTVAVDMTALGTVRLAQAAWVMGMAWCLGNGAPSFGLARVNLLPGFKRGALWCLFFALVAGIGILVLHLLGLAPLRMLHSRLPESTLGLALFIFVGTFIAPLAEELFFRGLVYGYFRRWGIPAALLVSIVFFVLPHMGASRIPFTQMVGGVVFA
ncbi:MAG: CPBP family intramembrane glutamic endopeptidase, partial [Pseudomonadota bacterium]